MAIGTFNMSRAKRPFKAIRTLDAIDVAARYFAYKLYEATDGERQQWGALRELDESRATVTRAVERGWVVLQDVKGKPMERKAALTDEGRRLERRA